MGTRERGGARGVTLVELAVVLAILGAGIGAAVPLVGRAVDRYRVVGAGSDLYGALHLTRARARQTGVMHALVIDPDGRTFRVVEDPAGLARTVAGPRTLVDGVAVSGNTTIRFSPKGFAVPFGTITVRGTDGEVRRLVVNILGRVRVEDGPPPR
jgi:prepilin-type N-terminal cleavage/methylation domain-containing protein